MTYFLIEHQCPQCGAPAVLEETERLFTCGYCRVKSYLLEKDYFRYILPENAPNKEDLLYFPFWRFRGMLFSALSDETLWRFVDVSQQAIASRFFPFSLGVRGMAMKLKFVSPETPGRFLKPSLSFKEVIRAFKERFNQSLPVANRLKLKHQAFIGEALSLIYAPFYLAPECENYFSHPRLFDGVLNKPVPTPISEDDENSFLSESKNSFLQEYENLFSQNNRPDWRIRFIPAICPGCGWDLSGERETLALGCRNCHSMWYPGKNGLKKLPFARLAGDGVIHLPFWRIKADVSGVILDSYADMIRFANIPKVVQQKFEHIEFFFWTLAFKISPQNFLRLSSNMTMVQPQDDLIPQLPEVRKETPESDPILGPVNLLVTEAVEILKICLADMVKPKKAIMSRLSQIRIRPRNFLLAYVPFDETPHEYIHAAYPLTIHKNLLKIAENL